MKLYKKRIKDYKNLIQEQYVRESSVQKVVEQCEDVMLRKENKRTSYFDFLYEQSGFIKKRWWVLQGCVLILLWFLLKDSGGTENMERIIGSLATSFAILIIPEVWKNRRFSAMEIEAASFYSLRQICAARTLLFAVVDIMMVTIFLVVAFHTIQLSVYEMVINFLIPFNVSSCICFRLLCSKKLEMEYVAVLVSAIWMVIWLAVVTHDGIYHMIAEPIWIGLILLSFAYLIFCIRKSQFSYEIIWEDNTNGIKF